MSDLYIATSTYRAIVHGKQVTVAAGKTVAEEGAKLLKKYPERWRKIVADLKAEHANKQPSSKGAK